MKILHPSLQASQDYCARFYSEALAASQLDHRNVLRVIDYGQEPDGLLYIVMELLEGKSLEHTLDTEGRLTEKRAIELVAQACAGLAAAHDAGVVHRDIKPENIVVVKVRDDDGRETDLVKVCDFGIAHWQPKEEEGALPAVDASKIVGTPVYMSPEQIQNEAVDARTDVYSLGVVLYELTTGVVPFLADDAQDILRAHLVQTPVAPAELVADLSPEIDALIMRCLEKEPERRPKDARDLRSELRQLVDAEASTPSGMHRKASIRSSPLSANDFVTNPAEALTEMLSALEKDLPHAYAAFGEALRTALLAGRIKLACDLVAWQKTRLADPAVSDLERDLAMRALNGLRDPEVARAHAVHLLDGKVERTDEAIELLRFAGPLAARAVIDARRVRPPSLELRSQFVSLLKAIGAPALSVIISSLEPLANLTTRQEEALAEDLLRALPDVRSDPAGEVTVRFVRLDKPVLGLVALHATTLLWGVRARPLLVGVLDAQNDTFRLAAIESLQKLGCVDDVVVDRIGRVLLDSPSPDLKLAAANALASATSEARPKAIATISAKLTPSQGLMSSIKSALGSKEDTRVPLARARSLFMLDPRASRITLERLASSRPELRNHLEAILAGR